MLIEKNAILTAILVILTLKNSLASILNRAPQNESPSNFLLPNSIIPTEYNITIYPIEDGSITFEGSVVIRMRVQENTDRIVLHMAGLHFLNGRPKVTLLMNDSGEDLVIDRTFYETERQMQVIVLQGKSPLQAGNNLELSMEYVGTLVDNSFGLNAYVYTDLKGRQRRILATYLQPVGARRVFPCFDEPRLKAHFTLFIGRKANEKVLSNMPLKSSSQINNSSYYMDEFERSILMPTNVVAFVVHSSLESISRTDNDSNITINFWSRKGIIKELDHLSELSTKILSEYEDLLKVPYPLRKLDVVALPTYPVAGMENFGLIISREKSLLSDDFLYGKEWSTVVAAHEVAHQWIGNQVTPHWWSEYWISEGFATYLAALVLERLTPSLEPMNHLIAKYSQWTRRSDHGGSATQLVKEPFNPTVYPSQGIHMYHKGASVLRMLSLVLGNDIFLAGIRDFFTKFAFTTTNQSDLVDTLLQVAGGDLQPLPASLHLILRSWTHQAGYPLVTFERQDDDGSFRVSQKQFQDISIESPLEAEPESVQWWIPLSVISKSTPYNPDTRKGLPLTWLVPGSNLTLRSIPRNSFVVANADQLSYLRVNYDRSSWLAIINQLQEDHHVIPPLSRSQIIDDALHLYKTGHLDVEVAMETLGHLSKEDDFFVWKSALDNLKYVAFLMKGEKQYDLLGKFLLSKIRPTLKRLENDLANRGSHMGRKMNLMLLAWACKFHDPSCVERARASFRVWRAQPKNLRIFPEYAAEEFLCSALSFGSTGDWNFAYKQMLDMKSNGWGFEESNPSLQPDKFLVNALACSQNSQLIQKYLAGLVDPKTNLTLNDGYDIMNSLARSGKWAQIAMDFLRTNYDRLLDRFGAPPAPFITNKYDLQQFQILAKEIIVKHPEWAENVDVFLEDGKKHATKNTRMITPLLNWLSRQ